MFYPYLQNVQSVILNKSGNIFDFDLVLWCLGDNQSVASSSLNLA